MKIGDWVLTPAGKRLQVKAIIAKGSQHERVLLSDQSIYDSKILRPAS